MFFSKPGEYEPCGMFSVGHFILLVLALSIVGIALSNTKNISKEINNSFMDIRNNKNNI